MTDLNTKCICCGGGNSKIFLSDLLRCSSCGHVRAKFDLNSLNSKDIYSLDYFQQGEYVDYIKDRDCFEKNFLKRIKSIRQYRDAGNLLEIGSASGFFLNMARQYFTTTGYEVCESMANYARSNFALDIKSVDFLEDSVAVNHYDMVVMWDCIEHLVRPDQFFQKIHSVLKNKGVVALTTGDINSAVAKMQGRQWRLIHPPSHVHYFTQESICTFLKNQGFEVMSIQYPGFYRSFRQMFYGLLGAHKKIWSLLNQSSLAGFPIYLNLFDIMQVIARKV